MSQQQQMAMQPQMGAGGPVNAPTPTNNAEKDPVKQLNTAIYDYLLCREKYEAARAVKDAFSGEMQDLGDQIKQSPNQRQANGVDGMDIDSKDHTSNLHPGIAKRPAGLPAPPPLSTEDGPFLQDWFTMFWDLFSANRQRGRPNTINYVGQQRAAQKMRTGLMGMDPNAAQRGYMMNNGQDLRQQVMKNGMAGNPQAQAQLAKMRQMQGPNPGQQGEAMQRQGSQVDMNAARSNSPNTGGDAPSPKRQRIEGSMSQARPGQPGQMPGGNQSVEVYSQAMQQQMQGLMQRTGSNMNVSKGMPPNPQMGPGGAQSSPMNQQSMDNQNDFYQQQQQQRMNMPQNGAAVTAAGPQGANNGNHALQDYQIQLMLLEQQNKKRLLMARQEQDSMSHPPGVPGPNGGQFAPGMSPQGSRTGDPSPNPNDMQRGTPNVKKMGGSPNGDMNARGSPTPNMMDPAMNPAMRAQVVMGPNGQQMMRPPSSHPIAQMSPAQIEMMRQSGQMMPNGPQYPGPQGPGGQMMPGQQPGQPGQPPSMTPRQGHMPPPPAPAAGPGGTNPSSPAQQPAPPTPNQANKAKPGAKKEAANKKAAPNKKGQAGGNDNADANAPPTPTPQAPQTPQNAASFNQNKNMAMANGVPGAGQPPNTGQPGAPPVQQPGTDMNGQPFGNLGGNDDGFGPMDFASLDTGDVLDNFDFDSFLNSNGDNDLGGFDANFAFGDGQELDIGGN